MKLVSWNVAGFRACLKKGFDDFFKNINADIFAIQESKVLPDQFDYNPEGYDMYLYPAEKKGYSGTLIYSKVKPINVSYGLGIEEHDHEGRVITLEFKDFYFITEYVPNVKRRTTTSSKNSATRRKYSLYGSGTQVSPGISAILPRASSILSFISEALSEAT